MSTLGTFQNDIDTLPDLELERYERIFKIYEASKDGKDFYMYNILNKLEFPDDISADLLDAYKVQSRMSLTNVSYEIYGNIESWWILFLLNKVNIPKLFYVEPGITLRFIKPEQLTLIYNQITRSLIYNGRHF